MILFYILNFQIPFLALANQNLGFKISYLLIYYMVFIDKCVPYHILQTRHVQHVIFLTEPHA